jgi:hypothetical protein
MGRDVSARTTESEQTAQARRRKRSRGGTSQVAITQGWSKREKVADPFIDAVRQKIDDEIYMNDVVRDTKHLHGSEMCKGDWCPRRSWYQITDASLDHEDDRNWWRMNSILVEGNYIHTKWQTWLWEMGILEGRFGCEDCGHKWWAVAPAVCEGCASKHIRYREVPLEQPDIMTWGAADGIYNMDGERAAIEIKSIGIGTLRFDAPDLYEKLNAGELTLDQVWRSIKTPFPVHLRQGMLYLRSLRETQGIDKIRFIYEFKATQEFKSFLITYNPRYLTKMLSGAMAVKRAIDTGGTVKRPSWAEDDHPVCKKCPYYSTCWK